MNDPRTVTVLGDMQVEAFPVNDERALRDEVAALKEAAGWSALDDKSRAAIVMLVQNCLGRLAENVEEWLPGAVVAQWGTKFGFFVYWKNGQLDEAIIQRMVCGQLDDARRLANLSRLAGRAHDVDRPTD